MAIHTESTFNSYFIIFFITRLGHTFFPYFIQNFPLYIGFTESCQLWGRDLAASGSKLFETFLFVARAVQPPLFPGCPDDDLERGRP